MRSELDRDLTRKFSLFEAQSRQERQRDVQVAEARGRQQGKQEMEDMPIRQKSLDAIKRARQEHDEVLKRSEAEAARATVLEEELAQMRRATTSSAHPDRAPADLGGCIFWCLCLGWSFCLGWNRMFI